MSYFHYFWKYAAICSQALFVPSSEYWRIQWSSDSSCTLRSSSMNFSCIIWTFELINRYHGLMVLGGLCSICCHCCDWVFLYVIFYLSSWTFLCWRWCCCVMQYFVSSWHTVTDIFIYYYYIFFYGSDIFFVIYMCRTISFV